MDADNSTWCTNRSFAMSLTQIKIIAGRYLFPPLFTVGLLANFLNLIILNSKGMRTRTNALLSAMAFADLCFFMCIWPSELIAFESYQNSFGYMKFFIYSRMPLTAMTHLFSTASTWLAMVCTVERVVAIKMPLHAKLYFTHQRVVVTIVVIYIVSFALNSYNFVWLNPFINSYCNNTKFVYGLMTINETESPNLHIYVQISWLISPFLIVYIPMLILIVLNTSLLYHLDKNRKTMEDAKTTRAPQIRSNEHKVAFTVAVIILSFIILSTPSAVLHLLEWFRFYIHEPPRTQASLEAATVANMLVVLNKASNFILYCTVSSKFRQQLMLLICQRHVLASTTNSAQRRSTVTSLLIPNVDESSIMRRIRKLRKTKSCSTVVSNSTGSGPKVHILKKRYTLPDDCRMPSLKKKVHV